MTKSTYCNETRTSATTGRHSVAMLGDDAFLPAPKHRDTQALHAKLDELLKLHHNVKRFLANADENDADEVER